MQDSRKENEGGEETEGVFSICFFGWMQSFCLLGSMFCILIWISHHLGCGLIQNISFVPVYAIFVTAVFIHSC